jgi:hypothetical protein
MLAATPSTPAATQQTVLLNPYTTHVPAAVNFAGSRASTAAPSTPPVTEKQTSVHHRSCYHLHTCAQCCLPCRLKAVYSGAWHKQQHSNKPLGRHHTAHSTTVTHAPAATLELVGSRTSTAAPSTPAAAATTAASRARQQQQQQPQQQLPVR